MANGPWEVLGIEPTREESEILRAYARKLRQCRPDEDPKGFQALVAARDWALRWRSLPQRPPPNSNVANDASGTAEPPPVEKANLQRVEKKDVEQIQTDARANAPDPLTVAQQQALTSISIRLRDLLHIDESKDPTGSKRAIFADAKPWRELLLALDHLTIPQRRLIRDQIVRSALGMLPEPELIQNVRRDYARGKGPIAIVGLLENEFKLSQQQALLMALCGPQARVRYQHWMNRWDDFQTIAARNAKGLSAYRDSNAIPVIPQADLGLRIWPRPSSLDSTIKESLQQAQKFGRWPLEFDTRAFFFPRIDLLQCGMPWLATLSAIAEIGCLSWLISIGGVYQLASPWESLGAWLAVVLAFHFATAVFLKRLAIISAISRIREADLRGYIGDERREAIIAVGSVYGIQFRLAVLSEVVTYSFLLTAFVGHPNQPGPANDAAPGAVFVSLWFSAWIVVVLGKFVSTSRLRERLQAKLKRAMSSFRILKSARS
jgi:hypothetical protein